MNSRIAAAAYDLTCGMPILALNRLALHQDATSIALRGIALAQIGDYGLARKLLRQAMRRFAPQEIVALARCMIAEAEIALVCRDLGYPARHLAYVRKELEQYGDALNVSHAALLEIQHLLMVGKYIEAEGLLDELDPGYLSPMLRARYNAATAALAIRRLDADAARTAAQRAEEAARRANIPALQAEVDCLIHSLHQPIARLTQERRERHLRLDEVAGVLSSGAFLVDARHFTIRRTDAVVSLRTRPVLFALARLLAEAWPADASREALLQKALRINHVDEASRARLRVEIARLRVELKELATIASTRSGYQLHLLEEQQPAILAPPHEGKHGVLLAVLSDGRPWPSSSLASVLGVSSRSIQRALQELVREGQVIALGRGRSLRWRAALSPSFPTALLLPASWSPHL